MDALGHDWSDWVTRKAATCTEGGTEYRQCSRCGEAETRDVAALGHVPVAIAGKAATCTEAGLTEGSTCSRCGAVITAQQTIPALGHSPIAVAGKAAACTEAGLTEGSTCSRCGMVITAQQTIPALGHSPSAVAGKAATCTEAGLTEGSTCSRCGATLTAQQTIPALGHAWDNGTVTANPTCTANGEIVYFCTRCGETWSETLPATGHTPVATAAVEATCTTGGRTSGTQCSVCGAVLAGPQDTPALGHAWNEGTITQYPGCTYEGVKTYTCTRCGATTTETIAAYGHWWDEGVITKEAGYLEEGEITYTCRRDASHKKTEAIPVKETPGEQSVMSLLRNQTPDPASLAGGMGPDLLVVNLNPELGGSVLRGSDEVCHLEAEVVGGTEPYTYTWYYQRDYSRLSAQALEKLINSYCDKQNEIALYIRELLDMISEESPDGTGYDRDTMSSLIIGMHMDAVELSGSAGATLNASIPGYYYCEVFDEDDNFGISNTVRVVYTLHFETQPQNANKTTGDLMSVSVADGVPPYTYQWEYMLNAEEALHIEGATDRVFDPSGLEDGTVVGCIVTDSQGSIISSDTAVVYSADPLELCINYSESAPAFVRFAEPVDFCVRISGGVKPYEVKWYDNALGDQAFESHTVDEVGYHYIVPALSVSGLYTCVVTDQNNQTASVNAAYEYRQLTITEQPQGAMLPPDGSNEDAYPVIGCTVADGAPPYTVELYLDDRYVFGMDETELTSFRYPAKEPGVYQYFIADTNNDWAYSEPAEVKPFDFRIEYVVVSEPITKKGGSATLTAVTEGGVAPFTFKWFYYGFGSEYGQLLPETGPTCTARWPGEYRVTVTDDAGHKDSCNSIYVDYAGTAPYIIEQPQSFSQPYEQRGEDVTVSCVAMVGDPENNPLDYKWEFKTTSGWSAVPGSYNGKNTLTLGPSVRVRCIVMNKRTGERVISDEALLTREFTVLRKEQIGTSKTLEFAFWGGTPPYQFEYYRTCANYLPWSKPNAKVSYVDGEVHITIKVPDLTYQWSNSPKPHPVKYHVKVVDDFGAENWLAVECRN